MVPENERTGGRNGMKDCDMGSHDLHLHSRLDSGRCVLQQGAGFVNEMPRTCAELEKQAG